MTLDDIDKAATQAVQDLKSAIDKLSDLENQPGADGAAIDARIAQLQQAQVTIRAKEVTTLLDTPEVKTALQDLATASAGLTAEAANLTSIANAIQTADKVIAQAADFTKALAVLV